MARLQQFYKDTVVAELVKQFGYKSVMEVPRITKITLNMGVGEAVADKKVLENAIGDMQKIAGQKPVATKARKSIAGFKIRAGMNRIGLSVTLRGARMYEFLDRFVNVSLPRVRDFHGVSGKAFDKGGNYNLGIVEQSIFPELSFEETQHLHGLQITFVIKNGNQTASKALLVKFSMPFEKEGGAR